jgi:hypothetical protein
MTWALCLNCGEIKFGAICPCPKCQAASTGDMNLDIAFSDHRMAKQSLEEFGKVVAAIREKSLDRELCFWAFIRYVSLKLPSILGVELKPDIERRCDQLLEQVRLPPVTIRTSPREELQATRKRKKRWWQFWKRNGTHHQDKDNDN